MDMSPCQAHDVVDSRERSLVGEEVGDGWKLEIFRIAYQNTNCKE